MAFRVSSQMINRHLINDMQSRQRDILSGNRQISSGLKFERPSEAPIPATRSLALERAIAFNDRLQRNASDAVSFTNEADVQLGSVVQIMQRARELSIRAASEVLNEQQLGGLSGEIIGIIERLTDIANSSTDGGFTFGGFQTGRTPFNIEKNMTISGTSLRDLGLSENNFKTRQETKSLTSVQAGAFSLKGGSLVINHVDIGSLNILDGTRTAAQNAQTLTELVNEHTEDTGVTAQVVNLGNGGTFDNPFGDGSPTFPVQDTNSNGVDDRFDGVTNVGIALANIDHNGEVSGKQLEVSGRGFQGVGGELFRRERFNVGQVRFETPRVGGGDLSDPLATPAPIPAITSPASFTITNKERTVTVNMGPAPFFQTGNTPADNAKIIADAVNAVSSQSNVEADLDGNGFIIFKSNDSFEIAGAPTQLAYLNGVHTQQTGATAQGGAAVNAGAIALASGDISINGHAIEAVTTAATNSSEQNAQAIATAINARTDLTQVKASTDGLGNLVLSGARSINLQLTANGQTISNLASGIYDKVTDRGVSGSAVGLTFSRGSLVLNGIDVFHQDLTLSGSLTVPERAIRLAKAINTKSDLHGISAFADSNGQLRFANNAQVITNVNYRGDSGERNALIGQGELLPINMSGDKAFGGNKDVTQLISANAVPDIAPITQFNLGDLLINGVDITAGQNPPGTPLVLPNTSARPDDNVVAMVAAINAISEQTGVYAEQAPDEFTNGAQDRIILKAPGQNIEIQSTNPNAQNIFQTTGFMPGTVIEQQLTVFDAMIRFRDNVLNSRYERDRIETISFESLKELDQALESVLNNQVELGVNVNRAELVENRIAQTQEILVEQLSKNQDTDLAEAIPQLTQDETALQAALSLIPRANQLSLINFI